MLLYTNLVCLPEFQKTAVQFNLMRLTLKSLKWLPKSIWRLEHFSVEEFIHHALQNTQQRHLQSLSCSNFIFLTMKLISKNTSDSPNNLYPLFICPWQEGFVLPSMFPKSLSFQTWSLWEHSNFASVTIYSVYVLGCCGCCFLGGRGEGGGISQDDNDYTCSWHLYAHKEDVTCMVNV